MRYLGPSSSASGEGGQNAGAAVRAESVEDDNRVRAIVEHRQQHLLDEGQPKAPEALGLEGDELCY